MPYFFFEEEDSYRSRSAKWDLIDQAATFDEAKAKQKSLRQLEKLTRKVVKVVHAESLETALRACTSMMNPIETKRWAEAQPPFQ